MSNNHASMFLSKVIDTEDEKAFGKYGMDEDMFISETDKKAHTFTENYRKRNGQLPSYAALIEAVPEFNYVPGVTDSFEYLAKKIRTRRAQVEFNTLLGSKDTSEFINENKDDMEKVITTLTKDLESINMRYIEGANTSLGVDIKRDVGLYKQEYQSRKEGETVTVWNSAFPYINETLGGYFSGNLYTVYGRSGRGKSAIVLREVLEFAQQGATVLVWSLEMPGMEVLTRLYTMLSAKLGLTKITLNNEGHSESIDAGFDSGQLRNGSLPEEHEKSFEEMLDDINEHIDGTIIVRGVDDADFEDRSVDRLRRDIERVEADIVSIDPFYYMDYASNKDKTTGGAAAETSKKLRKLAGAVRVPIIAMTQAEEIESESTADENRELTLPKRKEVKTTKSLMQDATALIAIDTNYLTMRGIIGIAKGRNGGEGTSAEITFLPNYGVIEELKVDPNIFDF